MWPVVFSCSLSRCVRTSRLPLREYLQQSFLLEDAHPTTGEIDRGRSAWTAAEAGSQKGHVRPVVSVVEYFKKTESSYKEFDCGTPEPGQCRFGPGESIGLSLQDWGRAAGINFADIAAVNYEGGGTNGMYNLNDQLSPGEQPVNFTKPLLRLTGAEVVLDISYWDPIYISENIAKVSFALEDAVISKIKVKANVDWTSMQVTSYGAPIYGSENAGAAETRFRYYYGIRFVFQDGQSGMFGYLILPALVSILAVVTVYFGMVGWFMKKLLTAALGDTTRHYKRFQGDTFHIDRDAQQVAPTRALVAMAAFKFLLQPGQRCLSLSRLEELFQELMRNQLDRESVDHLAWNVFRSIATDERYAEENVGSGENAQRRKSQQEQKKKERNSLSASAMEIELDAFVTATMKTDALDMPGWANCFDKKDKPGCVERVFGEQVHTTQRGELKREAEVPVPELILRGRKSQSAASDGEKNDRAARRTVSMRQGRDEDSDGGLDQRAGKGADGRVDGGAEGSEARDVHEEVTVSAMRTNEANRRGAGSAPGIEMADVEVKV